MVRNFTITVETIGILHLLVLSTVTYYFLHKKETSLVILDALRYGGIMG